MIVSRNRVLSVRGDVLLARLPPVTSHESEASDERLRLLEVEVVILNARALAPNVVTVPSQNSPQLVGRK